MEREEPRQDRIERRACLRFSHAVSLPGERSASSPLATDMVIGPKDCPVPSGAINCNRRDGPRRKSHSPIGNERTGYARLLRLRCCST
jgi:hypothetical protein